ncbi:MULTISPECIES: hypothetical protein [unclassified Ensifer]|uniref:hypothetical protein n=1 Tax=unclassified Ensifer TaxID=2633371 RepID=UPI0008132BDF|nr:MULTISPECIES: hypothetical protein [unclassified Ensifer]OCP03946.1 hypothetical protein BBX50_26355 [Ensifer sp. LC11]OCP04386.1 hypothetical protein BC374_26365 [Ensifer sp. LC13]OCP08545.1 hypothetical protein BC362_01855 [Ensifer sp. LC14]OCP30430.1 hypothetical protein BC364_26295 [Ensifer sp. LC499]
MTGREGKFGVAVRLIAVFALVFLTFAHKPLSAKTLGPAEIAAYQLPDGTTAEICFGMDGVDHDSGKGQSMAPVCEACRLSGSILLPVPPAESVRADTGEWQISPVFAESSALRQPLRLLPPSRGPPARS